MYSSLMDGEVCTTKLSIDTYMEDLVVHIVKCTDNVNIGYFAWETLRRKMHTGGILRGES